MTTHVISSSSFPPSTPSTPSSPSTPSTPSSSSSSNSLPTGDISQVQMLKNAMDMNGSPRVPTQSLDDTRKIFELYDDPTGERINPYQRCIDYIDVWKNVVQGSNKTTSADYDTLSPNEIFCQFLKLPGLKNDVEQLNTALNEVPFELNVQLDAGTILCIYNFIQTKKIETRLLGKFESGTLMDEKLHPILFYRLANGFLKSKGETSQINNLPPLTNGTESPEYVIMRDERLFNALSEFSAAMSSVSYLAVGEFTNRDSDLSILGDFSSVLDATVTAIESSNKKMIASTIINFIFRLVEKSLTEQQYHLIVSSSGINGRVSSVDERVKFIKEFWLSTSADVEPDESVTPIGYFDWKKVETYQPPVRLTRVRSAHEKLVRGYNALFRRIDREFRVGPIVPPGITNHVELIDLATDYGITIIIESLLTSFNERDPNRNLIRELSVRLRNIDV